MLRSVILFNTVGELKERTLVAHALTIQKVIRAVHAASEVTTNGKPELFEIRDPVSQIKGVNS